MSIRRARVCAAFHSLFISALAGASSGPTAAHHSIVSTFFPDKIVVVEGDVVQFVYRNPHSVLQLVVKGEDGKSSRWAVEWAGTLDLDRSGVSRNAVRPGDRVIVTGNPARNKDDRRVRLKSIERPLDGWTWTRPYE